jgi:hypothetical protein
VIAVLRRIIVDYLIAAGEARCTFSLRDASNWRMTEAAVHGHNCTLAYPPISTIVG